MVHAKRNDPSGERGRVSANTGRATMFRLRETIAQVARWATRSARTRPELVASGAAQSPGASTQRSISRA
jgi:hypothetical protein